MMLIVLIDFESVFMFYACMHKLTFDWVVFVVVIVCSFCISIPFFES